MGGPKKRKEKGNNNVKKKKKRDDDFTTGRLFKSSQFEMRDICPVLSGAALLLPSAVYNIAENLRKKDRVSIYISILFFFLLLLLAPICNLVQSPETS
jgi:hypothetical protein